MIIMSLRIERPRVDASGWFNDPSLRSVHVANGHGGRLNLQKQPPLRVGLGRAPAAADTPEGQRAREYLDAKQAEAIRRLGEHRATKVQGAACVFPNKCLGSVLVLPRGPLASEVWAFLRYDQDTPQELRDLDRRNMIRHGANHVTAMHAQDDMDNWAQVTRAGRSPRARRFLAELSMGIRHEGPHPDYPGVAVSGKAVSETGQRGFYRRWQEFMNAENWKDIHIDPITAKFEGTATMKG